MKKFFLNHAVELGLGICREAIWDEAECCSWESTRLARFDRRGTWREQLESREFETSLVGPDLYGGTAGIALFLAELFMKSGIADLKRTAIGSLNATVRRANENFSSKDMGFLSGQAGLLWALDRAARCLDEPRLQHDFAVLAKPILSGAAYADATQPDDWVGGAAGIVACLLSLYRTGGAPEFLDVAVTLGRKLCTFAEWHDSYCYWVETKERDEEERPPMCGFAHGVSGIAVPLLKLYAITRDCEFLLTARGAFAYEDTLFLREYCNWTDTRIPIESGEPPSHMTAWCHGAPGIALAHLVGLEADPARAVDHREKLVVALETTLKDLERTSPEDDVTICHGAFGLIEIANICDSRVPELNVRQRAMTAAQQIIYQHGKNDEWPCGVEGRNASLFLGKAGIGHTMLRLAFEDEVFPVLLI